MPGRLDGKVALISGAARGQGAAEAKLFVREGASVVLGDILVAEGMQTAGEIVAAGGAARFVELDVTSEPDWRQAVAAAVESFGKLDVLVNNAGIFQIEGVEAVTREQWNAVIDVNQTGVWLGMKAAVPALRAAGGGSIVNISSIGGLVGFGEAAAYQATKGAVRLLTKSAAIEYAREGIRVNSVHPGTIDTDMVRGIPSDRLQALIESHPIARLGTLEDIAYGVLYLASDESGWVTGTELVIDGGFTAR
jgi:NAD(P)-dependent dehydrogenase (short-subunit alcohol dehydrogenase family)